MDPKGDRIRLIKSGQLKLPDSILKGTTISLTPEPTGRGGCLEGGARPRPISVDDTNGKGSGGGTMPMTIHPTLNSSCSPGANMDIPLPVIRSMSSIPLPVSNMNNIPLPPGAILAESIPLPLNASIPLPSEKSPVTLTSSDRKIRVSLDHLKPHGDELLCRSCAMKFSKQLEYDLHLQSEAHQQV